MMEGFGRDIVQSFKMRIYDGACSNKSNPGSIHMRLMKNEERQRRSDRDMECKGSWRLKLIFYQRLLDERSERSDEFEIRSSARSKRGSMCV